MSAAPEAQVVAVTRTSTAEVSPRKVTSGAKPGASRGRGGRQLDASRDSALRQATLELLAEVGYERLTVDAVAARARAGKATVYRRWASKADLVVDAVTRRQEPMSCPDTGSLRSDLMALAQRRSGGTNQFAATRLLGGLVSALLHDEEFRTAFQRAGHPGEQILQTAFSRAVARGEIARPANLDVISSLMPALAIYRLIMFGQPPNARFVRTVIDDVIMPLVAGEGPAGRR